MKNKCVRILLASVVKWVARFLNKKCGDIRQEFGTMNGIIYQETLGTDLKQVISGIDSKGLAEREEQP